MVRLCHGGDLGDGDLGSDVFDFEGCFCEFLMYSISTCLSPSHAAPDVIGPEHDQDCFLVLYIFTGFVVEEVLQLVGVVDRVHYWPVCYGGVEVSGDVFFLFESQMSMILGHLGAVSVSSSSVE